MSARFFDHHLKLVTSFPIILSYYGVARSLIAFSTLLTLVFNDVDILFYSKNTLDTIYAGLTLFNLLDLELARWIACISMIVVISGWRPRYTGLLHWYVTFSYAASGDLLVGGDHIATILTLFLLPISLLDARKWIWDQPGIINTDFKIICNVFHFAILIQASIIYFHAFSSKLYEPEWSNGTAVYYWLTHPHYGASSSVLSILRPMLENNIGVVLFTWGPLIIEILLFAGIFMHRVYAKPLFIMGALFHVAIAVFHGLVSFSIVMIALLYLYLNPQISIATAFKFKSWRKYLLAR